MASKHGLGSVLRDPKLHFVLGAILLPSLGWLSWYLTKYAMAQAGPKANATGQAITEVTVLFNTLCSCALLPLTSMVTAANQAKDPTRLLHLIGAGLRIGCIAGIVGEVLLLASAPNVLTVFESRQPLLSAAPTLSRIFNAAFAFQVISGALVGILFGMDEHAYVFACVVPVLLVNLFGTTVYLLVVDSLQVLLTSQPISNTIFTVLVGRRVRSIVVRLQAEKHRPPPASVNDAPAETVAPSKDGEPPDSKPADTAVAPVAEQAPSLFQDLTPAPEVWRDMLSATGGNSVRNLALSLKTFLCVVCATRLGNVPGSAFSLQQTLARHLAGPAGLAGLGATMAAPRLLEQNMLSPFIILLRVIRGGMVIGSIMWLWAAAWPGPLGVLASVGLNARDGLAGTEEEYLKVLTPLNHWIWAAATVANEIAAPFDGVLMSLELYGFVGALYAGNLFLVLLPLLLFTQRLGPPESTLDVAEAAPDAGIFSGYTGIMLVLLLWSVVRLVGCIWCVYWQEVPRRLQQMRELGASCSREALIEWVRSRIELPEEEFKAEKAEIMDKPPGAEREAFRKRDDGPWAEFAKAHNTTISAMEALSQQLYVEGDKEFQELVHRFFGMYGR